MKEIEKLLKGPIVVLNMGLEGFYQDLKEQNIKVVQIDWRPPAGGNKKMIELLNKLK